MNGRTPSTQSTPHRLGPFLLDRIIGQGGMGYVWRGRHVTLGQLCAVKVMNARQTRHEGFLDKFRHEVEMMARLDHPNIAAVLDMGTLPDPIEVSPRGSPYIVMEYIDGPTMKEVVGRVPWPRLKRALLDLLGALAHAHAIGVIHRDLKPQNILLEGGISDLRRLKLVDFGIAHLLDGEDSFDFLKRSPTNPGHKGIMGTPKFMAPEQIDGDLRDQGPWTDLYSLGCLAWYAACGQAPFEGSHFAVLRQQLEQTPGDFEPQQSVPPAFETWLRRLLAKYPHQRFQRAADAARALAAIPETLDTSHVPTSIRADASYPPLPNDWEREHSNPSLRLVEAGLTLWGLRSIPVVGRGAERDRLWEMMREVSDSGTVRGAILRGAAGCGKSKLARWMLRRTHEVGTAQGLWATHYAKESPFGGLGPMLGRFLHAQDLERQELFERLIDFHTYRGVPTEEAIERAAAVTEVISPKHIEDDSSPARQISSAQERYEITAQFLGLLARERPVLIQFDDIHWSLDTLGFVRYMLTSSARHLPVMLMLTLRDEELARHPHIAQVLSEMEDLANVTSFEVHPLDATDHALLVEHLLNLTPETAAITYRVTGGNPLFTIQLVDDWVNRGVLQMGHQGFSLAQGIRSVELPEDIHTLLLGRLEFLLESCPHALEPLEVAAALGQEVSMREWEAVCAAAQTPVPRDIIDVMCATNLATRTEQGWSFAHGLMCDVLERSARERGRSRTHHVLVAHVVRQFSPNHRHGHTARRIAEHLMAGGRWEEATEPLMHAIYATIDVGAHTEFEQFVDDYRRCLEEADLPEEHPLRVQYTCLYSATLRLHGKMEQAKQRVEDAIRVAQRHQWVFEEALGKRFLGLLQSSLGSHTEALTTLNEAIIGFAACKEREYLARTLHARAKCLGWLNRYEEAIEVQTRAATLFSKLGMLSQQGMALEHIAASTYETGDMEAALERAREALDIAQDVGNPRLKAAVYNDLGNITRWQRSHDQARKHFLRAAELYTSISNINYHVVHLNLGLNELMRSRWDDARAPLYTALKGLTELSQSWVLPEVLTALLCLEAACNDWETWQQHFAALEALHDTETASRDAALMALRAGEFATEANRPDDARRVLYHSLEHWRRLDAVHHIRHVEHLLKKI